MQDRYAGDIGDLAKFALLRALGGDGLRLGVVWYLNINEEENRDGSHTEYDLVFLDPDTGLAPASAHPSRRESAKYAYLGEVARFHSKQRSVVVYQHQRRTSIERQVENQLPDLQTIAPSAWAISFHPRSARIFYVLPANEEHESLLWSKCMELIAGPWGCGNRFRLHRDVYVFGYGSLLWGTGEVEVVSEQAGYLDGWHREWTWISASRHGAPTASLALGGRVYGKFLQLTPTTLTSDLEAFRRRERRATEQIRTNFPVPGAVTYYWTMGSNLDRFPEFGGVSGSALTTALARRALSVQRVGRDGVKPEDYIRRVHAFDPEDSSTAAMVRALDALKDASEP